MNALLTVDPQLAEELAQTAEIALHRDERWAVTSKRPLQVAMVVGTDPSCHEPPVAVQHLVKQHPTLALNIIRQLGVLDSPSRVVA